MNGDNNDEQETKTQTVMEITRVGQNEYIGKEVTILRPKNKQMYRVDKLRLDPRVQAKLFNESIVINDEGLNNNHNNNRHNSHVHNINSRSSSNTNNNNNNNNNNNSNHHIVDTMYPLHPNQAHPHSISPSLAIHPNQAYARQVYSNQAYPSSISSRPPSPHLVGFLPAQTSIVAPTPDSVFVSHSNNHPSLQYNQPTEYLPAVYADENNNLYVDQNHYIDHSNNFAIPHPDLASRLAHPDNSYTVDPLLHQSNPYLFQTPHPQQVFSHLEYVPSNMSLNPSPDLQDYNSGFVISNTLPGPASHHPHFYNPEFLPLEVRPNQGYLIYP